MADSVREQKLAAARKKLRQFQKKKGTKRVAENLSKENTPDTEGNATEESSPLSESGTLSSRASSIDLASEEFPDPPKEVKSSNDPPAQDSTVCSATQQANGVADVIVQDPPEVSGFVMVQGPSAPETRPNEDSSTIFVSAPSVETASPPLPVSTELAQPYSNTELISESESTTNSLNEMLQNPQPSLIEGDPSVQSNVLASYFKTPVQSDPFSLISQTSSGDLVTQVDPVYSSLVDSSMQVDSNAGPTIIEPDEPETQIITEPENSGEFQKSIPSVSNVLEQLKEVTPEVVSPVKTNESVERSSAIEFLEQDGSVSSETTASITTAIHLPAGDRQDQPILKSSSESLRQISLQLSGLMSETEGTVSDSANMTIAELERRNSELAALWQQERQTSQQQSLQMDQMKAQLERLETELTAAQGVMNSGAGSGVREIESMREQLQVHIQTIGILVSEKSELQSSFTHANHSLKQKAGEVTELDGRLSASRQRVSELESNMKDLTSQCDALKTQQHNLSKDLDGSKIANFKANKQCEEFKTSVAELTERLSVKTKDFDQLTAQLTETKSQLAMAQLHVQQLRDGTSDEIRTQLEQVQAAHMESQKQLSASEAALIQARAENTQIATQYQQYTTQLAEETRALRQQAEELSRERQYLIASLEETKSKLESVQNIPPVPVSESEEIKAERERVSQTIASLQEEKHQLQEQNNAMTSDNSQLSKLVDQLSRNYEELEMKMERTKTEEVDTSRLLAAMQSDKVAAARALTQNKQLKEQLEELQSGFIIMSNKKLELTEKLEKELHVKKGLNQEIASLNEEVANMKQQFVEREREMAMLKENSESLGTQLMLLRTQVRTEQPESGSEKLGQEEVQEYQDMVRQLEEKLKSSAECINNLTAKNNELNDLIAEYGKHASNDSVPNGDVNDEGEIPNVEPNKELMAKIASLTVSVNNLEKERSELKEQLEEEIAKKNSLSLVETDKTTLSETSGIVDEEFNSEALRRLREAHEALESRFNRCMTQVAELSDEKQNLEHVIQQLQVENDSIGDYITIYQFQRGVMKQQARERELELASLRHEREEMKEKLLTLQELMSTLAVEKRGSHQPELLKMETVINRQPTPVNNNIDGVVNGTTVEEHTDLGIEASENSKDDVLNNVIEPENDSVKLSASDIKSENAGNSGINGTEDAPVSSKESDTKKSPTVQRIIDLLNEMEATSQMEHCSLQKFHPCPLCSGKLITV